MSPYVAPQQMMPNHGIKRTAEELALSLSY